MGEDEAQAPATRLLHTWLSRQLAAGDLDWLDGEIRAIAAENADRRLYIALGRIPRRLGKQDLDLSPADLAAADEARPGWDPRGWSVDEAARIYLLCSLKRSPAAFAATFETLCRTADVGEAIAFYRGLPLYPAQAELEAQAAEGLRTNMRAVFEAVAHDNPFPKERFSETRWNHMVLKALFVGSRLSPIQGLDERANPELARILCDYAHERWAAGRPVTPELWRCVGPFATGDMVADLARAARSEDRREREAAALALVASPDPAADAALAPLSREAEDARAGRVDWHSLALEI